MEIPDTVNKEAYLEFIEFRKKEKKKPVGEFGMDKHFKLLSLYPFNIQAQMIDNSINCGYQGIFPLKQFSAVHNDVSQEALRQKQLDKIAKQEEELRKSKAKAPVNNVHDLKSLLYRTK